MRNYGGSEYDAAKSIVQLSNGNYVIAGLSWSTDSDVTNNHGSSDYWIVCIDTLGAINWQKTYGGSEWDGANSIYSTSDHGFVIAGFSLSSDGDVSINHGGEDYWILKLDSAGNIQWQKSFGGSGNEEANSIKQTNDGGYIVVGFTTSTNGDVTYNHGLYDYWIVKLDNVGNIEWQKTYGGSGFDEARDVIQIIEHGYLVVGNSQSEDGDITGNHGGHDFWILKLDSIGNILFQQSYGGSATDVAFVVCKTIDNGVLVTGKTGSTDGDVIDNNGNYDYWLLKFDSTETLQWQKCLGGSSGEESYSAIQTTQGNITLAGSSFSNDGDVTGHHGLNVNTDFWIVQLSNPTATNEDKADHIINISPNPSSTFINIVYSFEKNATLTFTDTYGSVAKQLTLYPYFKNRIIYTDDLSEGVYLVTVREGGKWFSKKVVVTR